MAAASRPGRYLALDASRYALALTGVQATANVFLVGAAVQQGAVPVPPERVRQAIELNGVAVEANLSAFEWGRRWVANPSAVNAAVERQSTSTNEVATTPLDAALSRRVGRIARSPEGTGVLEMLTADLVAYQDRAYADRFLDLVERAACAEARVNDGELLRLAVARGYHKLLAYKDEYEVARLMLCDDGLAAARAIGGDHAKVLWHLHPPTLRAAGLKRKTKFGPWARPMFGALARAKRLRGTPVDPFGRAAIRVLERQLPVEYANAMEQVCHHLTEANLATAVELAGLPDRVRGYEDLKARRAAAFRHELSEGLAAFLP